MDTKLFAGDGDLEDYDYNVEGGQNRLDVQVSTTLFYGDFISKS